MSDASTTPFTPARFVRTPVFWGLVFGVANVVVPLGFWWLDLSTVHTLIITLIAAVYIGFAVADGRPMVIAVETCVAAGFFVFAAIGVVETAWILVIAYFAHGERTSGSTERTSWPARVGGLRSVPRSTFLLPPSSRSRSPLESTSTDRGPTGPRCLSGTLSFCGRTERCTEAPTKRTG